jgi:hypothetical protein
MTAFQMKRRHFLLATLAVMSWKQIGAQLRAEQAAK